MGHLIKTLHVVIDVQVQLRERNEALFSKLDSVQNKLGQQAASKSDLSIKLVQCEEDKLKVGSEMHLEIRDLSDV